MVFIIDYEVALPLALIIVPEHKDLNDFSISSFLSGIGPFVIIIMTD